IAAADALLDVHGGGVESQAGEPRVGQRLGIGRGLGVEIVQRLEENLGLLVTLVQDAGAGRQLLLERRQLEKRPFERRGRRRFGLLLNRLRFLLLLLGFFDLGRGRRGRNRRRGTI